MPPLPPIYVCSQQDVISRFGGQRNLKQALDPDGTGSIDTGKLDLARQDASNDVMSASGNRFKLWLDTSSFPPWIVTLAAWRAVYYSWMIGTGGKTVPEDVKLRFQETQGQLDSLRAGDTGPGYGEPASRTSLRPAPIDNSDNGRRAVYATWRRSGFR